MTRMICDSGIEVCFANPGTTEMHLVDAMSVDPRLKLVLGLHETVCTGAADGYARMKGKAACTLLHLGPGLANGVANLHNAKRAASPILNVIGDMAVWHVHTDPPLAMDISGLADTVSRHVGFPKSVDVFAEETNRCISEIACPVKAGQSRISTLIVPHDLQWEKIPAHNSMVAGAAKFEAQLPPGKSLTEELADLRRRHLSGKEDLIKEMARELAKAGKAGCLFIGGCLIEEEGLLLAHQIASQLGTTLCCLNPFHRIDRGQSLPIVERMPYFPGDAKKFIDKFEVVVVAGTTTPVAMFGYNDGLSRILDPEKKNYTLDTLDVMGGMRMIAELVGCTGPVPVPASGSPPAPPTGPLNTTTLCAAIAACQPEGAIVVDESLTSGTNYWNDTMHCPKFSHLTLTGGSIGIGPPLSVGCAVACPDRRVINFQADGSGLYSIQALWTQAREQLKVTTVVCNNSKYQILSIEMNKQKPKHMGRKPNSKQLLTLNNPCMDWVALATGFGVTAVRVTTADELVAELQKALVFDGPYLIEAML